MADQQATSCWAAWRDLAVYGPIGLVALAVEELPKAAEANREKLTNRIAVARVVGQFAVRTAGAYVTRRLDDITAERLAAERAAAESALDGVATEPHPFLDLPDASLPREPVIDGTSEVLRADDAVETPAEMTVNDPEPGPPAEALALADYDSLAASQIVARLDALPADELEAIRRYESAHRQRRTVTGKIQQLQSAIG